MGCRYSPSGRIPGIDNAGNPTQNGLIGYFPENIDIEQFLDPNAFINGISNLKGADFGGVPAGEGNEFNFNLEGLFDGGRRIGTPASETGPTGDPRC